MSGRRLLEPGQCKGAHKVGLPERIVHQLGVASKELAADEK